MRASIDRGAEWRGGTVGADRAGDRDDRGSALILALVYLVAVSMIVFALANWAVNDLNSTTKFASSRSLQSAGNSVTQLAVQTIRYAPLLAPGQTLNASPPTPCWGSGTTSQLTIDGDTMAAWCSTAWSPTSGNTRTVTVSSCPSGTSNVACALNPSLQAVVTYDDYPPGISVPTTALCVVYCGTTMTVDNWVWAPVVPAVSSLSGTAGPITGGTPVTITGTGFVAGSTVNFVEEQGGVPSSANVIQAATGVTFNSSTSLSVLSPSVTAGSSYFVTVTTPGGTSAYLPVFTYSMVAPTATGLTPTQGGTSGGTSVTITGSGFFSGAVANFTEETGGVPVSGNVVAAATSTAINSGTSITATTPAITAGATYFVTVTTPGGTTAYGSSEIFTFVPPVPTITNLSATSGPTTGGTGLTVSGTGFVAGATVSFVEENSGTVVTPLVSLSGTGVNVTGSTVLDVTTPAITVGTTYFITVTTAGGISANGPVFTY